MAKPLQGRALAQAAADAIKEIEEREVAKQKAEVAGVVAAITSDIKAFIKELTHCRKRVEDTNGRIEKLQKRLKALKAGDPAALKEPPADIQYATPRNWAHPRTVLDFERDMIQRWHIPY